jgi:hypothetical protein
MEGRHYAKYHEIYNMFQNEEYPSDDEDIDEYKNIGKSGIHTWLLTQCFFLIMMLCNGVSPTCKRKQP